MSITSSTGFGGSYDATAATSNLAIDANALNGLKSAAHANSPEAIRGAAKQFEAIFLNMMLKSMRDATPHDGPLDSEQSKTFTSMLDQQLSQTLANKGMGLAEILIKQLSPNRGVPIPSADNPAADGDALEGGSGDDLQAKIATQIGTHGNPFAAIAPHGSLTSQSLAKLAYYLESKAGDEKQSGSGGEAGDHKNLHELIAEFSLRMGPAAERVSKATGVPAIFMLAQAALESGWGKHEIKFADGKSAHNLFGIKAGDQWTGRTAYANTSEFVDGVKVARVEKFRAYDSYADSFKDFVNLLKSNPRYKQVLQSVHDPISYSNAMQKSGYATDPQYGKKLQSTILGFLSKIDR
jgi:flagellar protein FlgJ